MMGAHDRWAYLPNNSAPHAHVAYGEKQNFFIMYHRIVKDLSWLEIGCKFTDFFSARTSKKSLTCQYYRIRKAWGLEKLLTVGTGVSDVDREKVKVKAADLSRGFLEKIGYFDE
jgi:hypothetical protein